MSGQRNLILTSFKQHSLYSAFLILTLVFFLYKGITYAVIGSYIPLLFILTIFGMFILGINNSGKAFIRLLGLWSVLIIIWASFRLLLAIVNQFVKPIPEGHVHAQLGIVGSLLSLVFLFSGIYLWKNRRMIFFSK